MDTAKVLIVDADASIRLYLAEILRFENVAIMEAKDGEQALELIQDYDFDFF